MRMARKLYSAREMANFARCSPFQLEYLKEIELLVPTLRSHDGGDRYDDSSLLRLQQIRVGRTRGLALEEIRRWLDRSSPGSLPRKLPNAPRLSAHNGASVLYVETEVKVETEADCDAFQEEAAGLYAVLSACRRSGLLPADARLHTWAERHCCHINRWFCPCDAERHVAFARAIANNPYHAASIERHGKELASFMVSVLESQTP
jgi:DNA-binding transcriptional MerR regulator